VKRVTTVWGGDHGGDAFQFGATVKVHFNDGTEPFEFEMSACEIVCRTDCAELLEKTIVDGLTLGLEKIAESKLNIFLDEEKKIQCSYGEKPVTIQDENIKILNKVFMYLTGDLAFFAMALGRESMSGHWCFLCKMCRSLFSKLDQHAEMWTMAELLKVADEVNGGKAKFGVKKKAWWPFIPLENYMIPLLHVLIGLGNDLLDSFLDWVNEELECLDNQEILTKRAIRTAEHKIIDATAERDAWLGSAAGKKLKSLEGMVRYRKNKLRELGAIVKSVQDARQSGIDSPLDTNEMLQDFEHFVDCDFDDDLNGMSADDEEPMDGSLFTVEIDPSMSDDLKAKIVSCHEEAKAAERESAALLEAKKIHTDRLKKTRAFLADMKGAMKGFRSVRKNQLKASSQSS